MHRTAVIWKGPRAWTHPPKSPAQRSVPSSQPLSAALQSTSISWTGALHTTGTLVSRSSALVSAVRVCHLVTWLWRPEGLHSWDSQDSGDQRDGSCKDAPYGTAQRADGAPVFVTATQGTPPDSPSNGAYFWGPTRLYIFIHF